MYIYNSSANRHHQGRHLLFTNGIIQLCLFHPAHNAFGRAILFIQSLKYKFRWMSYSGFGFCQCAPEEDYSLFLSLKMKLLICYIFSMFFFCMLKEMRMLYAKLKQLQKISCNFKMRCPLKINNKVSQTVSGYNAGRWIVECRNFRIRF